MKEAKKIVLKTHPDKSSLSSNYFLFFSRAYKRLYSIYTFQNKSSSKKIDNNEYTNYTTNNTLDIFFNENKFDDKNDFNKWFNKKFEKHKINDTNEDGYGEWFKSDDDIVNMGNISQGEINIKMEEQKKKLQDVIVHKNISDYDSGSSFGTALSTSNNSYTSTSSNISFTDLKQAYIESIIPVTQEDYQQTKKFRNVNEYKNHRDNTNITPLSQEDSLKQLYDINQKMNDESASLAYKYARESEVAQSNNAAFLTDLRRIK